MKGFNVFLGIVGGLAIVALGIFIVCLFTIPGFKPWGMGGVFVDSKYMRYIDEDLDYILRQENIMIESNGAEIHLRVRTTDQMDAGYVVVYEDANGISFNSTKRTQLDFMESMETIYDADGKATGVPYVKIKVRQPKGIMLNNTARVYINLISDETKNYNLIFDHGKSPVRVSYDDASSRLNINRLDVFGTGRVTFEASANYTVEEKVRVATLNVKSDNANINCKAPISGNVTVSGNSRDITLGDIGGSVSVNGTLNHLHTDAVGGNVKFVSDGVLRNNDTVSGNVVIRSKLVNYTATEINSLDLRADDEVGKVFDGDISVAKINAMNAGLKTTLGHNDEDKVTLENLSVVALMEYGELKLGSNATVDEEIMGVYGNVAIEKLYDGCTVNYAETAIASGNLTVRGYDGKINAWGVRGVCDIITSSMGNADVSVGFSRVAQGSKIHIQGSREPQKFGRITITLLDGTTARVKSIGTGQNTAFNIRDENDKPKEMSNEVVYLVDGGNKTFAMVGGEPALELKTANTVEFLSGNY